MPSSTDSAPITRSADPRTTLKAIVDGGDFELPLLPESSSKLLSMCNDPDCPPSELAECIRVDQSIATHVLRIANSPMYCSGAQIVSLQQVVARLGIQRIREIVLIVSCQGRVFDVAGFEVAVRNSFQQSLGTAAFAQEIARVRRLNVEDAFLCGLLHDIGRPILFQAIVDYQSKNTVIFDRGDVLEAVEAHRIAVGSSLIDEWKLPHRVAEAVTNQMEPDATNGSQEAQVLSLAIAFTQSLLDPEQHDPDELPEHPLIGQLNFYPEQVTSILAKSDEILDLINRAQ